jgi:hypothetical protein
MRACYMVCTDPLLQAYFFLHSVDFLFYLAGLVVCWNRKRQLVQIVKEVTG